MTGKLKNGGIEWPVIRSPTVGRPPPALVSVVTKDGRDIKVMPDLVSGAEFARIMKRWPYQEAHLTPAEPARARIDDAIAYCENAGLRLPFESEWLAMQDGYQRSPSDLFEWTSTWQEHPLGYRPTAETAIPLLQVARNPAAPTRDHAKSRTGAGREGPQSNVGFRAIKLSDSYLD